MAWVLLTLLGAVTALAFFGGGALPYVTCAVTLAAAAAAYALSRRGITLGRDLGWACAATLAAFLVWLAPLPTPLTRLEGGARFAENRAAADALREGASLGVSAPAAPWFPLTRNRAGTARLLGVAVLLFSAGLMAASLSRTGKVVCLHGLVALGATMAAAGLISLTVHPQGNTLWWLWPVTNTHHPPLGGFVNRNHFAGLLALLTPPAVCLGVSGLRRGRWVAGAACAAAALLMAAVVVLSLSRGAILACACGLLVTGVQLVRHHRVAATAVFALLAAAVVPCARYLPAEGVTERLKTLDDAAHTASGQTRLTAWRDSIGIVLRYPLFGAGPDAFRFVFPQHRLTSGRYVMTHAENEYVQTFADGGLVGGALLALIVAAVVRTARRQPERDPALQAAALGAATVAAAHACLDFPLHVPLYATVLASVVGLSLQSTTARPAGRAPARHEAGPPFPPILLPALAALLLGVDFACGGLNAADSLTRQTSGSAAELAQALAWSPTSWQAWYHYGRQACLKGTPPACRFGERCMTKAADYDPNNYLVWLALGQYRLELGDRPGARAAFRRVRELRSWVPVPDVPEEPR